LNDTLENDRTVAVSTPINAYSAPLPTLLGKFFEMPNVLNMIVTYTEELLKNKCIISDLIQSNMWKKKLEKNPNKMLFPFLLYFDEFETNNPLGSHAEIQKLGAIYMSLPFFPLEYASKLENIFLIYLFKIKNKLVIKISLNI